ncbi:CinA family protein [Dermacoccaceae bacterium W4C1]
MRTEPGHREQPLPQAVALIAATTASGLSLATAESLTGGSVCSALTAVPGASATVRGAVVAYATEIKHLVLGVGEQVLAAAGGAVQAQVAEQMALGVRRVLGADLGLATTGVAGPTEQDGQPVGRVFVAVAGPAGVQVRQHDFEGDRAQIRAQAVNAVVDLAVSMVQDGARGAD